MDAASAASPAPIDPQPHRTQRRRAPAWSWLLPAGLLLLAAVACQAITGLLNVPRWLLPSPLAVIEALGGSGALLVEHTLTTLQETAAGFALALVVGVAAALLLDASTAARAALYPLLVASQTVPIVAVAPLLVIWFGYGLLPKIIVVVLVCFFPIIVGTLDGLRAVEPDLIDLVRAMGAGRWRTLWLVRWPAALPGLFSGVRIAVTYSVIGAIVGEWVGASRGLGVFMLRSVDSFQTDRVFAAILICSMLSILLFLLVGLVERLVVPWRARAVDPDRDPAFERRP